MQINRRILVYLALILYSASLILPITGTWFAGVGLMVVSTLGSILAAGALFSSSTTSFVQQLQGAVLLLLPAYNVLIIYGLIVLRRENYTPGTWLKILFVLAASTATYAAIGFTGSIGNDASAKEAGLLCLFSVWTASLLTLAIASWAPWRRPTS